MTISATTPEQVNAFAAVTLAHALKLYAKTGMKVNRAYTPANMMKTATAWTGQTFKARDYMAAANALMVLAGRPPFTA
jgi:hypothetical protein